MGGEKSISRDGFCHLICLYCAGKETSVVVASGKWQRRRHRQNLVWTFRGSGGTGRGTDKRWLTFEPKRRLAIGEVVVTLECK
ncbi:unnamed protein product [Ilex paraguariensis]|uniref:Uncharacterized protein n=1 Tax=Ilex paraguariensis TaxID=185542 RepID=A0ABC8RFN1_9AQUA